MKKTLQGRPESARDEERTHSGIEDINVGTGIVSGRVNIFERKPYHIELFGNLS